MVSNPELGDDLQREPTKKSKSRINLKFKTLLFFEGLRMKTTREIATICFSFPYQNWIGSKSLLYLSPCRSDRSPISFLA
jgi:hypothetical protein